MREAARRAKPAALMEPFEQREEEEQGASRTFLVGPANPDFVPLAELPRYAVRAVTASEDAGFFAHSGFDFDELRNAAVQGAQAGRVVRGGSTISQQLAKNLFLSRERTLARKLHEAVLTVALEATVPKARLMEIYLNVAQWGPGVFGLGPAAHHWFGKDARTLSPREAAFLATVLPGPVRYHGMWARGAPSGAWEQRVDELLRTMHAQGNLSDEELETALGEQIVFAHPAAAAAVEQ
jgi:membrane peptidoglycan carboxypeptidase